MWFIKYKRIYMLCRLMCAHGSDDINDQFWIKWNWICNFLITLELTNGNIP